MRRSFNRLLASFLVLFALVIVTPVCGATAAPAITSVVNGLSLDNRLSPGVAATIYGAGLSGATSVTVGGLAAYISSNGDTQVNVQFPYTVPVGAANVVLT